MLSWLSPNPKAWKVFWKSTCNVSSHCWDGIVCKCSCDICITSYACFSRGKQHEPSSVSRLSRPSELCYELILRFIQFQVHNLVLAIHSIFVCLQGAHAAERRHCLHPQAGRCQLVWRRTSRQGRHFPHILCGGEFLLLCKVLIII